MLHLLPPEILSDILVLTLPPETAYSIYPPRQALLLSYSRVCRQLLRVAQPLLWRVYRPRRGLAQVLFSNVELAESIRVFQAHWKDGVSYESVVKVLKKASNVTELRLEDYAEPWPPLRNAAPLQGLHHLTLSHIAFDANLPFFLPHLSTLSLRNVQSKEPLLSSASMPKLQALYTFDTRDWRNPFAPFVDLSTLVEQLDMLQVSISDYNKLPPAVRTGFTPILISFDHRNLLFLDDAEAPYEHLHIQASSAVGPYLLEALLPRLQHPPLISSITHPHSSTFPYFSRKLAELCAQNDVDLVKQPFATDPKDDLNMSREFWEYAKELQRRKGAEVEGL